MKKLCVSLLLAAFLVGILAPGVSARSRPEWMDQIRDHAEQPQGDEGGWGVETQEVAPEQPPWWTWVPTLFWGFFDDISIDISTRS